ncbi:glycosyltransferase [Idiomarina abyssalis]|uniref:glycosyltransferase n=1 Tax=Idiomarina abyssalis TaxID=86102 RepID=UPI0006C837C7|nr:glycosyltransferase [Idiomarina abyssalis]SFT69577.1 Glycosyltransferase involved in cell wall bisynthesis [Idiomarina abyssalis]
MLTTKPKISVLILTFNQAQFIQQAMQSVVEQQSNNYELEVIVTDDGSSDGTVDVIERFVETSSVPIKVLAKKHEGVTAIAKNLLSMINLANGEFIAFLAGDDSFSQNRFDLQLKKFAGNPNLKISYSDGVNCIDGELGQRCHSAETVDLMRSGNAEEVYKHLTSQTPILFIQGVLAKADFLKRIQPFDVDLIADDWVFNIKVFNVLVECGGDFDFEPSICFIRNLHGDNTSRNLIVHYERVRQVAERYCSNPRKINSKFIANAIIAALKERNWRSLLDFSKKIIFYPESFIWILQVLFSSLIAKF